MKPNANFPKQMVFFTQSAQPTPAEATAIQSLVNRAQAPFVVTVMNNDANYSYGPGQTWQDPIVIPNTDVRAFDMVGGTPPAGFGAAAGNPVTYNPPAGGLPDALIVAPSTITMSHTATLQLGAVTKDSSGNLHDLTTDPTITWSSSDPTKATVGAHTGLVTGVAAGTVNIVATIVATDGSGSTSTAHSSVTLT